METTVMKCKSIAELLLQGLGYKQRLVEQPTNFLK